VRFGQILPGRSLLNIDPDDDINACLHCIFSQVNIKDDLVSKATVYNTLNLFVDEDLIKQVLIDSSYVFYDSNTEPHHHFYNEDTGLLQDIDDEGMVVQAIPKLPKNTVQTGIDVVIRIKNQS